MKIKLPNSLIQKIQGDYIASNFKDGVFTFHSLDNETIETVVKGLLSWAEENSLMDGSLFDTSLFLKGIKND